MAEKCQEKVDLGFTEETDPAALTNRYFPSKIGGKPAWLDLKNLPKTNDLQCPKCNEPRIFLCQIYAPIETREDCFHRSIFVFICRNEQCQEANSSENIIVFRSQLPRNNDYYSSEPPPEEDETLPAISPLVKLCSICGCYGPLLCSQCHKISYCSSVHQKVDWKYHKKICKGNESSEIHAENKILFPEFEIIIEPESEDASCLKEEPEENVEKRRLQEYEELVKSNKVGTFKNVPESELAQYTSDTVDDKQFRKFKKRISENPEQILRYERGGKPLWITDKNIPTNENITACKNCGEKRTFEFQIMPQLLNVLKEEKLDWGIIAVYTCQNSCNPKSEYIKEFAVKQDFVEENETSKTAHDFNSQCQFLF